jgi:hypothetical protein
VKIKHLLGYWINCVGLLFIAGCSTVTPSYPTTTQIRFGSDGFQDAGVKGVVIDAATGVKAILETDEDRQDYNKLVLTYGKQFGIAANEGWVPFRGLYAVRNDIESDYIAMRNQAKLAGQNP